MPKLTFDTIKQHRARFKTVWASSAIDVQQITSGDLEFSDYHNRVQYYLRRAVYLYLASQAFHSLLYYQMPRGKGNKEERDRSRGNAQSKYREAWADGAYNRDNSEDEDDEHEGPQPVRQTMSMAVYSLV